MIDKRVSPRTPEHYDRTSSSSGRIDPGPYIGIVKNNVDPAFRGRLQVFIPDLGGNELEPTHWRSVSYASPFFGSTHQIKQQSTVNYKTTSNTYGMWFVPPDIDNWVLVTFVSGHPDKGFWFACVPSTTSHHMVPAIGSHSKIEKGTNLGVNASQYPVAEFNEHEPSISWDDFRNIQKPVHEDQLNILVKQGLEADTVRGTITSSSQRESPSNVFGISTPGRPLVSVNNATTSVDKTVPARKGGHSFVMDDGDLNNTNQLVRLRTAGGHQILMHDTEQTMYIANGDGKVWMEFAKDGRVYLYSAAEVNIRSNTINFHADRNINMYAGSTINMRSASTNIHANAVDIRADGDLSLLAGGVASVHAGSELVCAAGMIYLNTKQGKDANQVPKVSAPDTVQSGAGWSGSGTMSTCTSSPPPSHEPYAAHKQSHGSTSVKTSVTRPVSIYTPVPESAPPMLTGSETDKTIALIKKEEGLPRDGKAYWDPPGQTNTASIGYGHQITAQEKAQGYIDLGNGEQVPLQGANGIDTKLTPTQSEALLAKDLPKYQQAAKGPLGDEAWGKLNDDQKAVMTSYAYNTGSTKSLVKGGLRDEILAGNTQGAADVISNNGIKTSGGNYNKALDTRRQGEAALFASNPMSDTTA
jgi:GH24 family phage-related lysozyme (muramidase)